MQKLNLKDPETEQKDPETEQTVTTKWSHLIHTDKMKMTLC